MPDMKIITTTEAPEAIGPYSQAVQWGNLLFTSGQIPLKPDGTLVEGGITEQAHQVFKNLEAVLKAAGTSFNNVIKVTVFLKNMDDFPRLNEVYSTYFTSHKPARSTIEVSRLPKDVLVEIEMVANVQ